MPVSRPSVTVLLCTHNGERFLREQLDTILAQQDVEVRIAVRDDGSTDSTRNILRSYAERHENVQPVYAARAGVPAGYFELMWSAGHRTGYYAFADQDDVWAPRKLAEAVRLLERCRGPSLYCSAVELISDEGRVLGVRRLRNAPATLATAPIQNVAIGNTIVFTHEVLQLVRKLPRPVAAIMHDWWMQLFVLSLGGHVLYDQVPRCGYRQHARNALGVPMGLRSVEAWVAEVVDDDKYQRCKRQASEMAALLRNLAPLDNVELLETFGSTIQGGAARFMHINRCPFRAVTLGRWVWYCWHRMRYG